MGAINESSPSIGFSAAKTTRKGAPFHGAIGDVSTASPAAPQSAAKSLAFGAAPAEALARQLELLGAKGTAAEAAPLLPPLENHLQQLDQALVEFMAKPA